MNEAPPLPPLSQDDLDVCRAYGISRILMCAVRHPNYSGNGRYFVARLRGIDAGPTFQFWGAELSLDNMWITLHGAYDPHVGDNEICAVDVRVADIVAVTIVRPDWVPNQDAIIGAISADQLNSIVKAIVDPGVSK